VIHLPLGVNRHETGSTRRCAVNQKHCSSENQPGAATRAHASFASTLQSGSPMPTSMQEEDGRGDHDSEGMPMMIPVSLRNKCEVSEGRFCGAC
jgi:hypothetical protein